MSNGHIELECGQIDLNEQEARMYMITQSAVRQQLEPVISQTTRNTTAIKYLKWITGGLVISFSGMVGTFITVIAV